MNSNKNALIYIRQAVSTGPFDEGLIKQKKAVYEFAEKEGYNVIFYMEHLNRSGNNTEMDWLWKALHQYGQIRYILVYTLDRLSRDATQYIKLEKCLETQHNIKIVTVIKPQNILDYHNNPFPLYQ